MLPKEEKTDTCNKIDAEFLELWIEKRGTTERNGRLLCVLCSERVSYTRTSFIKHSYKTALKVRRSKCAVYNRIPS
jgi:hypothetical protein